MFVVDFLARLELLLVLSGYQNEDAKINPIGQRPLFIRQNDPMSCPAIFASVCHQDCVRVCMLFREFNNVPVPNRLMMRLTQWNKIGDKQMIINGAQPEWTSPIANFLLQQMKQPHQFEGNLIYEQEYHSQLNEELKNGIIKETNSIQVYNPTFIVPRKDGRLRKILDCRRINFFTKHVHFKMDGAEQLRQILQQSDYAIILGIIDAFHHIHVQPNLQQFLGFKFKNKSYMYLGLLFGWNLNPFILSIKTRLLGERRQL
ncbi:MAG: hypothetical protein EZS28_038511, partial [Streblomastix strix]